MPLEPKPAPTNAIEIANNRLPNDKIRKIFEVSPKNNLRRPGVWQNEEAKLRGKLGAREDLLTKINPEARNPKSKGFATRTGVLLIAEGLEPQTPSYDLAKSVMTELIINNRPDVVLWTLQRTHKEMFKNVELKIFITDLKSGAFTFPEGFNKNIILAAFDACEFVGHKEIKRNQTPLTEVVKEVVKAVRENEVKPPAELFVSSGSDASAPAQTLDLQTQSRLAKENALKQAEAIRIKAGLPAEKTRPLTATEQAKNTLMEKVQKEFADGISNLLDSNENQHITQKQLDDFLSQKSLTGNKESNSERLINLSDQIGNNSEEDYRKLDAMVNYLKVRAGAEPENQRIKDFAVEMIDRLTYKFQGKIFDSKDPQRWSDSPKELEMRGLVLKNIIALSDIYGQGETRPMYKAGLAVNRKFYNARKELDKLVVPIRFFSILHTPLDGVPEDLLNILNSEGSGNFLKSVNEAKTAEKDTTFFNHISYKLKENGYEIVSDEGRLTVKKREVPESGYDLQKKLSKYRLLFKESFLPGGLIEARMLEMGKLESELFRVRSEVLKYIVGQDRRTVKSLLSQNDIYSNTYFPISEIVKKYFETGLITPEDKITLSEKITILKSTWREYGTEKGVLTINDFPEDVDKFIDLFAKTLARTEVKVTGVGPVNNDGNFEVRILHDTELNKLLGKKISIGELAFDTSSIPTVLENKRQDSEIKTEPFLINEFRHSRENNNLENQIKIIEAEFGISGFGNRLNELLKVNKKNILQRFTYEDADSILGYPIEGRDTIFNLMINKAKTGRPESLMALCDYVVLKAQSEPNNKRAADMSLMLLHRLVTEQSDIVPTPGVMDTYTPAQIELRKQLVARYIDLATVYEGRPKDSLLENVAHKLARRAMKVMTNKEIFDIYLPDEISKFLVGENKNEAGQVELDPNLVDVFNSAEARYFLIRMGDSNPGNKDRNKYNFFENFRSNLQQLGYDITTETIKGAGGDASISKLAKIQSKGSESASTGNDSSIKLDARISQKEIELAEQSEVTIPKAGESRKAPPTFNQLIDSFTPDATVVNNPSFMEAAIMVDGNIRTMLKIPKDVTDAEITGLITNLSIATTTLLARTLRPKIYAELLKKETGQLFITGKTFDALAEKLGTKMDFDQFVQTLASRLGVELPKAEKNGEIEVKVAAGIVEKPRTGREIYKIYGAIRKESAALFDKMLKIRERYGGSREKALQEEAAYPKMDKEFRDLQSQEIAISKVIMEIEDILIPQVLGLDVVKLLQNKAVGSKEADEYLGLKANLESLIAGDENSRQAFSRSLSQFMSRFDIESLSENQKTDGFLKRFSELLGRVTVDKDSKINILDEAGLTSLHSDLAEGATRRSYKELIEPLSMGVNEELSAYHTRVNDNEREANKMVLEMTAKLIENSVEILEKHSNIKHFLYTSNNLIGYLVTNNSYEEAYGLNLIKEAKKEYPKLLSLTSTNPTGSFEDFLINISEKLGVELPIEKFRNLEDKTDCDEVREFRRNFRKEPEKVNQLRLMMELADAHPNLWDDPIFKVANLSIDVSQKILKEKGEEGFVFLNGFDEFKSEVDILLNIINKNNLGLELTVSEKTLLEPGASSVVQRLKKMSGEKTREIIRQEPLYIAFQKRIKLIMAEVGKVDINHPGVTDEMWEGFTFTLIDILKERNKTTQENFLRKFIQITDILKENNLITMHAYLEACMERLNETGEGKKGKVIVEP